MSLRKYLDQLLFYIHLNPVKAGLVFDPAEYRWSGHRELPGKVKEPIVNVDAVLRLSGNTRWPARKAYRRRLNAVLDEEWSNEEPGHLPW